MPKLTKPIKDKTNHTLKTTFHDIVQILHY